MKILFIVPHARPYDSQSVRQNPTGGTERAATFLGEALTQIGHEVRTLSTFAALVDYDTTWAEVVVTQHAEQFVRFPAATRKIWWCHQATDRPFIVEGAAHARRHADDVVTLSHFHQRDFARNLGIESTVIGYGVWLREIVRAEKHPAQLVYCSVPHRGLHLVPELFPLIRQAEPTATMHVCSSLATWGMGEQDIEFAQLFETLRRMEGVTLHGGLGQTGLWNVLARSSIFFYPCVYEETYCMAMDEALAHGCVPVIPAIGALPERWPPTARLVHQVVQEIRSGQSRLRTHSRPPDWTEIAEKWHSLLLG